MKNQFFLLLYLIALNFLNAQNVGIGTGTPHNSAKLEVQSSNSGILVPRLTTTERNAITSPANSLLIFNTDSQCYEFWNAPSSQWVTIKCGCSTPTSSPVANPGTSISKNSFNANWNIVSGATSYFLDVATNSTFTNFVPGYNNLNVGSATSHTITGLTCQTQYYFRIRALNDCGISAYSNVVSVKTDYCIDVGCFTIGETGSEKCLSMVHTTDGGYVMAGFTNSFGAGNYDAYIVKLDSDGDILWTRTVGGTAEDDATCIIQTTDGGFIFCGNTSSYGIANSDVYIVKLDANGIIQWTKTIGGSSADIAYSITQTSDGGYAVAGWTYSFGSGNADIYVVKLNPTGIIEWTRTIGGTLTDVSFSIIQAHNGDLVVAGYTDSFGAGNYDFYVVRLNRISGSVIWTRTIGYNGTLEEARSIIQTSDRGFIIAGAVTGLASDFLIVKLNISGNFEWAKVIGGSNNEDAKSIKITNDGGFIVAGYTNSGGAGNHDMYIVKLSASGNLQWSSTIGGCNDEYAYSIIQTSDYGYVVAGFTNSFGSGSDDFYFLKLDKNGNSCISCPNNSTCSTISSALAIESIGGSIGTGGIDISGGVSGSGGIINKLCSD